MKVLRVLLVVVVCAGAVRAQSISIGPISKLTYCTGDSIFIPYSSTGTFQSDNGFILQWSDANGSFEHFSNSVRSVATSGVLATKVPGVGSHYRVRVISSDPYAISSDNGADIQVISYPHVNIAVKNLNNNRLYGLDINGSPDESIGLAGTRFLFFLPHISGLTYTGVTHVWKFSDTSSTAPANTDTAFVTFESPGVKTATLIATNENGCTAEITYRFYIGTCNPQIPKSATVVTTTADGVGGNVWVKPGGTYYARLSDTVFAEPSSVIHADLSHGVFYLRPGSQFISDILPVSVVILPPGSNGSWIHDGTDTFQCADLTFDYSQVSATGGVAETEQPQIAIHQTGDHLFAHAEGEAIEVRVVNALGVEVMAKAATGDLDLDYSLLPSGVYFAAISTQYGRSLKRIAVLH